MADRLIVRSYRRVFRIDRRIYRVDRWALPVPGGVPLRSVSYFAAALGLVVLAGEMPALGSVVGALSPPLRYVVVPLVAAVLASQAAPDGRVAHRFAADWLRLRLRARRRSAGRPVPLEGEPVPWSGAVATVWDQHASRLHRGRVRGPARVRFGVPVQLAHGARGLTVSERSEGPRGDALVLGGGTVLEVRE
jgi:TcpE family